MQITLTIFLSINNDRAFTGRFVVCLNCDTEVDGASPRNRPAPPTRH